MTAFTLFSHGTQDLYPTFLQKQHHLNTQMTGRITIIMNIGAVIGALIVGALSERLGRRRTIIIAALLALPVIPLWAYASTPLLLAIGAFLMQAAVQGAWAMVPAHLNELSPPAARAMFPGLVYQLGGLLSARSSVWQAGMAERHHGNYALALATFAVLAIAGLVILTMFGPEQQGKAL